MNQCNCRWCRGERPYPENITENCSICGEFIYWSFEKYPHCWREYIGDKPHNIHSDEGYSHGKRLGKVWI